MVVWLFDLISVAVGCVLLFSSSRMPLPAKRLKSKRSKSNISSATLWMTRNKLIGLAPG